MFLFLVNTYIIMKVSNKGIIIMITLQINIPLLKYKAGDKITLETDKSGNIIDSFWYRRFKDAAVDNCVEIFKPAKTEDKKTKKGNE
jgi:hypothetical protein